MKDKTIRISVDTTVQFQFNFRIRREREKIVLKSYCRKSAISKALPHNDKDALNFLFEGLGRISDVAAHTHRNGVQFKQNTLRGEICNTSKQHSTHTHTHTHNSKIGHTNRRCVAICRRVYNFNVDTGILKRTDKMQTLHWEKFK